MTEKLVFCPAASVNGKLRPVRLNSVPLVVACVIVSVDPPEFVNVSVSTLLVPVCTLPKLRVVGLALNTPAATPVPLRGAVRVTFDALELTVNVPEVVPEACGAKATDNDRLCPGERTEGTATPLALKPVPAAETWLMVTLDPPVLLRMAESF